MLGRSSPIDAILAAGIALAPPDSDVEPFYPIPPKEPTLPVFPSAFLSHTTADEQRIRTTVYPLVEPYFGSVFMLNIGMAETGSDNRGQVLELYKRRILGGLLGSDWVVVYLSQAAARSPWVRFELAYSLQNKSRNRIIALLPDAELPATLAPVIRLVWQVPLRKAPWWNRTLVRYALRGSGARETGLQRPNGDA